MLPALDPPSPPVAHVWILPERLPLLPHEVVVGPVGQLGHVRDVVVDRPEALHRVHSVNLLQVGLVLGGG